ncbi:MAG: DUF1822 family protein [Oscillatoriophycideae cyanobacterium NC_groundwater_1537_Pr4_S-0.65um_50_18]|nr:DUF1822 family protein [Oscillatoriophycideae cyanobacterium NC_groundwater_1537_Pr4_S-0.65um_50_18]
MSSDAIPLPIITDRLYLEIPDVALEPHQAFSTSGAGWRARLNQLSLEAILPWLQEERQEERTARVWPSEAALPSFWEFVNGTAIACEDLRLVILPTTDIDLRELRVPQEWVDIASWSADCYLAVQVNLDAGWIRIWGYATHNQLKTKGTYNPSDRTYSLDEDALIQDLNVLWIAHQLCPEEPIRAAVAAIPTLPLLQAKNLLERLGNPSIVFPRLAVPFPLWAALLEHGGWRQRLYERRQGLLDAGSVPQWLQSGLSDLAQQLGWSLRALPLVPGMRSRVEPGESVSRQLSIAGNLYELQVFPREDSENRIWRFELRPLEADRQIPPGFKLRLLTEDLQPFDHNEDTAIEPSDRLYVDVILEPEEGIVWEIDPPPEGYDREILNF